jgi:hypothetical protein
VPNELTACCVVLCVQRSGKLPRISNTPWRGNSAVWDSVLLPNGRNYSLLGGWYDDGGMLKLSYPTAFTVSLLSWAYWEFKQGYISSDNVEFGANTIRWGADYLNTVAVTNVTSSSGAVQPIFVAQVCVWRCTCFKLQHVPMLLRSGILS